MTPMAHVHTRSNHSCRHVCREDWELAQTSSHSGKPREPVGLWRDLASAAESGWDFSSRWFENPLELATIRTTQVGYTGKLHR